MLFKKTRLSKTICQTLFQKQIHPKDFLIRSYTSSQNQQKQSQAEKEYNKYYKTHKKDSSDEANSPQSQFNLKPTTCYYKLLNVSTSDTSLNIRKSYLALTKKYHPDVNPHKQDLYILINQAYEILSDKKLRTQYDQSQGIDNPDWDELDYMMVSTDKKTEDLFTDELPKDILEARQKKREERDKEIEEALKGEDYFKLKYFENPEMKKKKGDDPWDFSWNIYEKLREKKEKRGQDYVEYFSNTIDAYWEKKEDVDAHKYWRLRGVYDLRYVFGILGTGFGTMWYLDNASKQQQKKLVS